MKNKYDLTGQTALITGAGVGIGRATAIMLASAGAFVGIHYNSSEKGAKETLATVRKNKGDGILLKADLTDEKSAYGIVDKFVKKTGRLDILFNNAGSPVKRTKIEDCPLSLWRKVFDTNITSAFLVTKRAIPHLRKTGNGRIVNNLSLSIQTGGANGAGPYGASKGALQIFTRTLAKELAPEIRTNAICPGVIETGHHKAFSTPERMEQYCQETPLKRNGRAEEVASTVLFLVSPASSFLNGALIDINGGRFLR